MRRAALAVLLTSLVLPLAGAHGPPIDAEAGARDDLSQVPRDWTVAEVEPLVRDLIGTPRDAAAPDLAFRVHADAMLLEGALTVPQRGRPSPPPFLHVGVRMVDLTFTPALALADGARLSRLLLGPLAWDTPVVAPGQADGLLLATAAAVPWPDDDGVSPPENTTEADATGLRVDVSFLVVGRATEGAGTLHEGTSLSPAEVWVALDLDVPREVAIANGTTVRFGTLFDFVPTTEARRVTLAAWEGVLLERDGGAARLVATGERHDLTRRDGTPVTTERSPATPPLSVNVTHGLAEGGGRVAALRLGFLMSQEAWHTPEASDPAGGRREDAPGVPAWSIASLVVVLAALCRRRRERP